MVTYTLLTLRKENPDLFLKGQYIPLETEGSLKHNLMAFARHFKDQWLLVMVPLITADLSEKSSGEYLTELDWGSTRIVIPETEKGQWKNILSGEKYIFRGAIPASEIFATFGVGLFTQ